jgi:hypothetical protein
VGSAPLVENVATLIEPAEMHLAGGRPIGSRVLDDHLHDVPDAAYALLEETAAHAARPPVVILERDGNRPPFARTLAGLERARGAVERGRSQRQHEHRLRGAGAHLRR